MKNQLLVPAITQKLIVIKGQTKESRVGFLSSAKLKGNQWNIILITGIFDGHSETGFYAGEIAQKALNIFWKELKKIKIKNLKNALEVASFKTDETLIRSFHAWEIGTDAEIVVANKTGLFFFHLGTGQIYWSRKGTIESQNFPCHIAQERIDETLKDNRTWGDGKLKKTHSEILTAKPNVKSWNWKTIKKLGVEKVLIVDDGFTYLLKVIDPHLLEKIFRCQTVYSCRKIIKKSMDQAKNQSFESVTDDVALAFLELRW